MIDKIAFLFVEGVKNFTRNKLANFICIITIFINFTILGTFFVFGYNTDNIVNFFRSKYTFEVFLNSDISLDQAVSLNLAFPAQADPKFINKVHLEAWKKGIKTLYYMRTESVLRGDIAEQAMQESCLSCDG